MKVFSKYINEAGCATADINQGNALNNTGVTNHLTPIGNIVTNVKNLFCLPLGVVACVGEDGVSIKLNSSRFVSPEEIQKVLYNYEIMRGTCLASYIMSQGLDLCKTVNIGQFYVVYFCPSDIKSSQPGVEPEQSQLPCKEQLDFEVEMINVIKESEDDEEIADVTKKKLSELINSKDKVKAAKQFELLIGQEMELPREYYFAGVKDKAGNESIALRWKYTRRAAKNQTTEITKSLINIYDEGKDGVFVADFDKDSMFQLPEEVKKLIENILEFIGAQETDDPCVYSVNVEGAKKKDEDKKEDENNKDDKSSDTDNKDDKSTDDKTDDKKSDDKGDDDDLL